MSKKTIVFWIVLLAIIVALAIPKIDLSSDETKVPVDIRNSPIPANVKIALPEKLDQTIYSNGSIIADETVEIASEINGKVTKIGFKEGESVNKNDLLVKLDDSELQARLKKEIQNQKLRESIRDRKKALLDRNAISQEEFDVALNDYLTTTAEIDLIKAQILKTEIIAPFDGKVGMRNFSSGSYVNPGTILTTLNKIDPIKIDFSIPAKYKSNIKIGDEIKFRTDNGKEVHEAKIYAIDPSIDKETRTINIRAKKSNPNGLLTPGNYVTVDYKIGSFDDAILIPTEALIADISGKLVYVLDDGKAKPVNVKTGIRTSREIQITEGLTQGDTIVISAIIQMKSGAEIAVKEIVNKEQVIE